MVRLRVRYRRGEIGAQSLEWLGLGTFVVTAMAAASKYADGHLGGLLGDLLINHLKQLLGNGG